MFFFKFYYFLKFLKFYSFGYILYNTYFLFSTYSLSSHLTTLYLCRNTPFLQLLFQPIANFFGPVYGHLYSLICSLQQTCCVYKQIQCVWCADTTIFGHVLFTFTSLHLKLKLKLEKRQNMTYVIDLNELYWFIIKHVVDLLVCAIIYQHYLLLMLIYLAK